ncbi:hypothetical protein [Methylobacterium sp. JK268]
MTTLAQEAEALACRVGQLEAALDIQRMAIEGYGADFARAVATLAILRAYALPDDAAALIDGLSLELATAHRALLKSIERPTPARRTPPGVVELAAERDRRAGRA